MTNKELTFRFAEFMAKELDNNAHKGDWKTWFDIQSQLDEADYHQTKLREALNRNDSKAILEHCADCANFYLMIANSKGLLSNEG